MTAPILTAERLREMLSYSPETGLFVWRHCESMRKSRNSRVAGKPAGNRHSEGYLTISFGRDNLYAHRMAWLYVYGELPKGIIDHINGIRTDNRIANLRDTTRAVNMQNYRAASKNSKSGLLGAYYNKSSKRYNSELTISGRRIRLGSFDTAEEAHAAYVKAKRRHHPGCTI